MACRRLVDGVEHGDVAAPAAAPAVGSTFLLVRSEAAQVPGKKTVETTCS